MRILLDGQSLLPPRTGIGRVTNDLLRYLEGHPEIESICVFFCIFPGGVHWKSPIQNLRTIFPNPKILFRRIPLPLGVLLRSWNRLRFPKIESLLGKYDLVHGPAHVLPSRKNTPGLIAIHDTSLLEHPEWYPRSASLYAHQIHQAMTSTDGILVPSQYVRERLINLYNSRVIPFHEERIFVMPNPFTGDYLALNEEEKIIQRRQFFGNDNPYLVWIGEWNPRKNIQILPGLLRQLHEAGRRDLRLIMLGKEGYRSGIFYEEATRNGLTVERWNATFPRASGDILLTGYLENEIRNRILASAELLVFPSLDEGFGYPILEAMASGIPAVCAHAGALPEIGGPAVITVPPGDVDKYIRSILALLSHRELYENQRVRGMERVSFFRKQAFSNLLSIYRQLAC